MTRTRQRWLTRIGLAVLVAAGLNVVVIGPAVATDAPVINVTGYGGDCSFDGETTVGWKIWQEANGGVYGGPVLSLTATPTSTLFSNSNNFGAPIQVSQVIPHGSRATTASLTVEVDFDLPGGHQVVTATGTTAVPFCPDHVRASAAFAMNCDRSVTVKITYPATAETTASVAVAGTSLSGATWQSGPLTLQIGEVRTVVVPSPYTTEVDVSQKDAIASQDIATIGRSGALSQPRKCPAPAPPANSAPAAPPPNQGSGGGGTGSSGTAQVTPGVNPFGSGPVGTQPAAPGPSPSTAANPVVADPEATAQPVAASAGTARLPLVAVAGLSAFAGLGSVALLAVRRRRRSGLASQ